MYLVSQASTQNFDIANRPQLQNEVQPRTSPPSATMPPRLPALRAFARPAPPSTSPLAAFLLPFLQTQTRSASILSSLSDNPAAYGHRIRRGRGPSSGKGKTSGRGHKGQKQHGKTPALFQGGQTPLRVVHGERGFKNLYASRLRSLSSLPN